MQTSQPVNTVLIDDSDPSIQYSSGWVNKPSLLRQSEPNYPMYGTLHETVTQTYLIYSFSGSSITACAQVTANFSQIEGTYLWNCFVDRVQVNTFPLFSQRGPAIHVLCCETGDSGLSDQVQHEIHISAIGSQDLPISFDYLIYETSLAMPVADLLIYPSGSDPAFRNIEGWEVGLSSDSESGTAMITTEPKANFTFDFYGSSILWFGFYNTTFAGYSESEYSYSVDNSVSMGSEGRIILSSSTAKALLNGSSFVNFLLFRTFALPRGQHRLEVNYASIGSGKAIPLTLTNLVVQNSTINPNSSVPTTIPTPPAAPSAGTNEARKSHLALGCCGGAVLALLILGIFCARRRVKTRRDRTSAESSTSSLIEPFNHDPASASVEPHQKGRRPSEVQEQGVVETAEVQVDAPPSYVTGPHES